MPSNARCWTRPQTALGIATLFLSACAGVGSDVSPGACPPVVEYSRAEQARVAEEVAALPEGALIVGVLGRLRRPAGAGEGLRLLSLKSLMFHWTMHARHACCSSDRRKEPQP